MKANAISLLGIFEQKVRLEVPLFQRQYVWDRESQWEPLWEDISRKFVDYLEGRRDTPVHFLGAMVLDQKQTPITHVPRRQVIDGQQRLTTLQIFLSAFRDFSRQAGCDDVAKECDGYTQNKGMMADPEVDKFKVWPTHSDRPTFVHVVALGSRDEILRQYPRRRKKYARVDEPRPRIVEAYLYFYDAISEFFKGTDDEPAIQPEAPLPDRLDECLKALKGALQVVAIDLEQEDDAQVIFETLNARGEPLLPADLLRNYIFLRAARQDETQEPLYEKYWRQFDEPFWREEVRQGRLSRPRSDLFMQHFLTSRKGTDIPVRHLFAEYKHWIQTEKPFAKVEEELAMLARQRDHFKRMISPADDDPISSLSKFLDAFDIRSAYPLLLAVLDTGISAANLERTGAVLESYLLRRAVCGLGTKNYSRIFLQMTRGIGAAADVAELVRTGLANLTGPSAVWPDDVLFQQQWMRAQSYYVLNNPKMVHLLSRLNEDYWTTKNERIQILGPLTIEHVMPQEWRQHWQLKDGTVGLDFAELERDQKSVRAVSTSARDALLHTFGNLTLLTQELNSAVSNSKWTAKKPELLRASVLPINQVLHQYEHWDETTILKRGAEMFDRAKRLWKGPTEQA